MDCCAWASGLGRAAHMHIPGAGSLLPLVRVAERGGHRQGGLGAAVRGCGVPCPHAGGVLASSVPFVCWEMAAVGGLVRLCGLGEVGGGRALWSQQDCGVSGTQQPPTSTPRPSLERVSHSRECICPRPFRSLFHFTCSVPRFGEEVSSTSVSTSLSWQCVCTGRGGSAGEGERGVSGVRSAL